MTRKLPPPPVAVGLAAVVLVAVAGCSSGSGSDTPAVRPSRGPAVITAPALSCDHGTASDDDKDTIERVGGLVTDDYVVKLAESTRLGVVALVTGDTTRAFDDLGTTYDVAVVARIEDGGTTRVTGFQQIRELVARTCG